MGVFHETFHVNRVAGVKYGNSVARIFGTQFGRKVGIGVIFRPQPVVRMFVQHDIDVLVFEFSDQSRRVGY